MSKYNQLVRWVFYITVFTLSYTTSGLHAQDSLRTGIKYGFLPQLSYNSDFGLIIGGEAQRYNYNGQKPFSNYTYIRGVYITNGAFAFNIRRDEVRTFNTDIRTAFQTYIVQDFNNFYFGDTEQLEFDEARFDSSEYFNFSSFRLDIGVATRIPIRFGEGISRMDIKTGLNFVSESPRDNPDNRFINSSDIIGKEGAFLSLINLGLIIEKRDSEFRAERGYYVDVGFNAAPPLISTHTVIENYLDIRAFLPLTRKIPTTLATRLNFKNVLGDVPYWLMPSLAGAGRMRGYMFRQFVSDNALSYSMELRTWFLKIPFKNIELGGTAFIDRGRVFTNENWAGMFSNHKVALGLGGVMSIFTPDFILKCEMGFSEERTAIYLGTGYSF